MRLPFLVLLLAACSPETSQEPPTKERLYAGEGRDRLCIKGSRAGFIAFGAGDANCTSRGRLERSGTDAMLLPDGDEDCRVPLQLTDERVTLAAAPAACSYYCGPGASFQGRAFTRSNSASPAIDFGGDPLC